MIQFIAPLPQFEPSVVDLSDITQEAVGRYGEQIEIRRKSSFNETTNRYYAYAAGWVSDPGNYRRSMWEEAGSRPSSRGGRRAAGMSQEAVGTAVAPAGARATASTSGGSSRSPP